MMEEQLLSLLQKVRDDRDEEARVELNDLLRKHPEARSLMAKSLVDEQALVSHLRDQKIVSILDAEEGTTDSSRKGLASRLLTWPQQIAAVLVASVVLGLLGVGVVWALNSPESEARAVSVSNGDFEDSLGLVKREFPSSFRYWAGDPAEVIEEPDGNRILRFLETANVTGKPNGGASACNVFQLIDLSSLQQEWKTEDADSRFTLELSARFRRESASTDDELPRMKASCTIHLYQVEPDSIGKAWPQVISEAVAIGNKVVRLEPGEEGKTITASCILEPEATLALISVNVNAKKPSTTPIELGGYYADDIQLTVIRQPNLPVRLVK
ncbi:hypothetical protein N9195_01435 [bacterium]|nr:hypothetical protein [bacterium]